MCRSEKTGRRGAFSLAAAFLIAAAGCVTTPPAPPAALKPSVISHETWAERPPVGYAADATRRNIAPGDTLRFNDLTVVPLRMMTDSSSREAPVDEVAFRLQRGAHRADVIATEGEALNWQGFHLAVLAVHADEDELGAGLIALEVATIASLPTHVARSDSAGGAAYRLRISHEVEKITLHHSGSAEPLEPGDDPVRRLRALQSWGQRARNWWDVPYHFLIDLEGRIYEGRDYRYMGETNTAYDPRGHLLISVIGNYNLQKPTAAQIEAITDLMTWAVARFDISTDQIYGHYELARTSCPGTYLRQPLEDGTFQERVEARLEQAGQR